MRRRAFITLLGGAVTWPLAVRAQRPDRVRRIGVLMSYAADDRAGQARLLAFAQELAQSGWIDGRNVRIDVRWGAVDAHPIRASSPPGLHQQAGHMTASDLCAARQMISCQAGAIHT
jgi:hypothetical protein